MPEPDEWKARLERLESQAESSSAHDALLMAICREIKALRREVKKLRKGKPRKPRSMP